MKKITFWRHPTEFFVEVFRVGGSLFSQRVLCVHLLILSLAGFYVLVHTLVRGSISTRPQQRGRFVW